MLETSLLKFSIVNPSNWTERIFPTLTQRRFGMDCTDFSAFKNLDGNRCRRLSGFQILSDDEIVTYVQAESDPDGDETDGDEDNNNEGSKGPSNAGVFSPLETAIEWYEQQSRVMSYSTTAAQENQRPCSEK
ncbi:hypothetical protein TNCV_4831271 [Trichonephila clavipes]|nr:hypothetical protein TNCV_4831271 [Trichonephila clavipes]